MTLDCPNCGTGELTFNVLTDWDGEGPWATPITVVEIVSKTCACRLTVAQEDDLERRAVEYAAEAGAPD